MELRSENNPRNDGRATVKPTRTDGETRSFHAPKAVGGRCRAMRKDGSGRCRAQAVSDGTLCIGHMRAEASNGNDR